MNMLRSKFVLLCVCTGAAIGSGGNGIWVDPAGDATIRRTDVGNNAVLGAGFDPIDLLSVHLQGWQPFAPSTNPYTGFVLSGDADIVRMQIVVKGLVAPPGPLALDGFVYNPTMFGDRPIYGYFEIDIDDQRNTGGDFLPIARNRYLANVGRFGASPSGSISDRMVRSGFDSDTNFFSDPQFERSGAEFTLLLCGCFTPSIVAQNGNNNSIFDTGETWIVSGRFFERFASFQSESALFGGFSDGLFDPTVELQFVHNPIVDETTITLVYPITNAGAALLAGEPVQPIDLSLLNHTSIEEAIDDLIDGSMFATGALDVLVDGWEDADTTDFRRPERWDVQAILGTAPLFADPSALFIWTDTGFDEVVGDLNDDDLLNSLDSQIILDTIANLDGTLNDADGKMNGQVAIPNFGFEFNLVDINGDGVISRDDIMFPLCQADFNADGTLNFFDISTFLNAYSIQDPIADFNSDGTFNFFDISAFLMAFSAGCS